MKYSQSRARRWRRFFSSFSVNSAARTPLLFVLALAISPTVVLSQETDLAPKTALFAQDFSSSSVVADYVSGTPNAGQFNAIGTTGGGMVISISGGQLQYSRTANSGSFSRTADFTPTPTTMKYAFDLTISGNTAAQTTAAVLQVGSGFGTGNTAEVNANVFSRIGVNWTVNAGEYSLRNIATSTNSPNFSGTQTVTWFMNNSDASLSYFAPDGSTEPLADNTADLWIGTTRVFNDFAATTPTQVLTDLKFVFNAGVGTIQIDNIHIEDILVPTAAAVSLSGRVSDPFGNAVRDAVVVLEGSLLTEPRKVRVNSFGNYRLDGLQVGTYMITVHSRRSTFAVPTRTVTLHESVSDADFTADPEGVTQTKQTRN